MSDIEKSELLEGNISRDLTIEPLTDDELEALTISALDTILWSSGEAMDENDEFLFMWDLKYTALHATTEAYDKVKSALEDFVKTNAADLTLYINHPAIVAHTASYGGDAFGQVAHDWVLSVGGHGTGFWDRGTGKLGKRLDNAAGDKEIYLFAGEDAVEPLNVTWAGQFHIEGL